MDQCLSWRAWRLCERKLLASRKDAEHANEGTVGTANTLAVSTRRPRPFFASLRLCERNAWFSRTYAESANEKGARPGGFTLVELLVVLLLLSLLLAVVPPLFSRAFPGVEARGAARTLAATLRNARSEAVFSGHDQAVILDLENKRYQRQGSDRVTELPGSLEVGLVTAREELLDERVGAIRFYPDGSSTGGRVTLGGGEDGWRVDVDWISGRIDIHERDAE